MDVLIVSRGLPVEDNPTFGIFEFDQAKALKKAGVNVTFFAIDLRSIRRKRKFGISYQLRENIDCYTISIPVGAVPERITAYIGKYALNLLYKNIYTDGRKPDIIHAHFTLQGYMASELSVKENIPLVITEHSSKINSDNVSKSLLYFANIAYNRAKIVIAVGNELARKIKKLTNIDCVVIHNIVNLNLFDVNLDKKNSDSFRFVSVGRLVPLKKMDLLIKAFAKVRKTYSNIELIIYGDGEEKNNLKKLARSLEISKYVIFAGAVSREEIAQKLPLADCFILLSEKETFGVAYIEAIASGVPVIASKCGGPEDFMKSSYGLMIDCKEFEQVIKGMIDMIEKKVIYDPFEMRNEMKAMFSEDVISSQIIEQYKKCLMLDK